MLTYSQSLETKWGNDIVKVQLLSAITIFVLTAVLDKSRGPNMCLGTRVGAFPPTISTPEKHNQRNPCFDRRMTTVLGRVNQ